MSKFSAIPRRTLTRVEAGDPAVRIGTVERPARALGMTLLLAPAITAKPTPDELDQVYRNQGDDDAIADRANQRNQTRQRR